MQSGLLITCVRCYNMPCTLGWSGKTFFSQITFLDALAVIPDPKNYFFNYFWNVASLEVWALRNKCVSGGVVFNKLTYLSNYWV